MTRDPAAEPLDAALACLAAESKGLEALTAALRGPLRAPFARTVDALQNLAGRVIVAGMGKSGHVGRKIAATLSSTGTPAYFVHPAEASHGDLGMIAPQDAVLALSWSGETAELRSLIDYAQRFGTALIAITAEAHSTLARAASVSLVLPKAAEACPHGLAPTTSTLMQLALGDALAMALLRQRGFTHEDFGVLHPGGKLGAGLKQLGQVMHAGAQVPRVGLGTPLPQAILAMTKGRLGCVLIENAQGQLEGLITDGDLRRALEGGQLETRVDAVMTVRPVALSRQATAGAALHLMNTKKISVLPVMGDDGRALGLVHVHDLLGAGVA